MAIKYVKPTSDQPMLYRMNGLNGVDDKTFKSWIDDPLLYEQLHSEACHVDAINLGVRQEIVNAFNLAKDVIKCNMVNPSECKSNVKKLDNILKDLSYSSWVITVSSRASRIRINTQREEEKKKVDDREKEQKNAKVASFVAALDYLRSTEGGVPEHCNITDMDSVIYYATERRIDELTKEYGDEIECGCDECGTWDGQDNRCNCRNIRVCWGHSGTFPDIYVYPEQY